jgi:hypothetical protein
LKKVFAKSEKEVNKILQKDAGFKKTRRVGMFNKIEEIEPGHFFFLFDGFLGGRVRFNKNGTVDENQDTSKTAKDFDTTYRSVDEWYKNLIKSQLPMDMWDEVAKQIKGTLH